MKIEECQIYEIVKKSLPIGFTLVDEEGMIVDFNPQAEVITGYLKSEVIDQSHVEILHGTSDRDACPLFRYAIQRQQQTAAVEHLPFSCFISISHSLVAIYCEYAVSDYLSAGIPCTLTF
jgi:PAS domain-containing protein